MVLYSANMPSNGGLYLPIQAVPKLVINAFSRG